MKTSLLQLVQETKQFLQLQLVSTQVRKVQPKTTTFPQQPPPQEKKLAHVPQPIKRVKVAPPKISTWELHAMDQVEENLTLRHKLEPFCKTHAPHLPVRIYLTEEHPSHRLFLENVARAITTTYSPAIVCCTQNLSSPPPSVKLIIAPISLLNKSFVQVHSHQIFTKNGVQFIPLDNLDLYSEDVNSKRALWAAIQHSFRS